MLAKCFTDSSCKRVVMQKGRECWKVAIFGRPVACTISLQKIAPDISIGSVVVNLDNRDRSFQRILTSRDVLYLGNGART